MAIAAARLLLLAKGPDAITLKAVADTLEMSHTNLIHHFGSAGELQSALMREMVRELTTTIEAAVMRLRSGHADTGAVVDLVFNAFDAQGAGRLAAWIVLSGNSELMAPVGEVVRDYVASVERGLNADAEVHRKVTSSLLFVTMSAFGDAIIGANLCSMIGQERDAVRRVVAELLPHLVVKTDTGGNGCS
jgi:TetR/AcrR family transcriptional regulator, repressor for neighboring sulfatase